MFLAAGADRASLQLCIAVLACGASIGAALQTSAFPSSRLMRGVRGFVTASALASVALVATVADALGNGWSLLTISLAALATLALGASYWSLYRAAAKAKNAEASLDARRVAELEASERRFRVHARRLQALHDVASAPAAANRDVVSAALALAVDECALDWAYCGAVDADGQSFVIERSVGASDRRPAVGTRVPLETTLAAVAVETDEPLVVRDVSKVARFGQRLALAARGGYVAVPLRTTGTVRRVVGFSSRRPLGEDFAQEGLDFLRAVSDVVGTAIAREIGRRGLSRLAFYDALTGLPNRVLLGERIAESLVAAKTSDARFAVMYLDLDGFKAINDRFGHAAGDDVLRAFGGRLAGAMRESDTTARLGGDEFVVLAQGVAGERDAARVAARIFDALRDPIRVRGREHALSASIGIALFPRDGATPEVLLGASDAALYAAKAAGKNAMRFANAEASSLDAHRNSKRIS